MAVRRTTALFTCAALGALACGAPGETSTTPAASTAVALPVGAPPSSPVVTSSSSRPPLPSSTASAVRAAVPDDAALFALLRPELASCYELGKKATPEMTDGKLTLNASIDASGKPLCVIPSDHTGLTQEVEDCMSARFAAQKLPAGAPWSATLPVAIRAGAVQLGERASDSAMIESVETFRMPDAFEIIESLEPALQACMRGLDRSSGVKGLLVGARVGADGRPQCALATSRGPLPASVSDCAAGVLRGTRFPPPKRGAGLVLVPIGFGGAK